MTTECADSKCQLADGKPDTQKWVLFSEPMRNLVPAATATLSMSQFVKTEWLGKG